MHELSTDVLILGGGTGGVAAALAAAGLGKSVILTEETDWVGGQLTSQAVPPDENSALRENKGGGDKTDNVAVQFSFKYSFSQKIGGKP